MRPRHAKIRDQRDANHGLIVSELISRGFEVIETERPLDILIRRNDGICGFAEIKTEARNATIYRGQVEFMANTNMPVNLVKTPLEAVDFAETMIGLTSLQKTSLYLFLIKDAAKKWHPAAIERILNV